MNLIQLTFEIKHLPIVNYLCWNNIYSKTKHALKNYCHSIFHAFAQTLRNLWNQSNFFPSSEISVTLNRHYITVIPFSTLQLFFMYIDLPDFAVTPTVYTIIFFQREKLYNCGSICYLINNLPTFLQFTNEKSDGTYIG